MHCSSIEEMSLNHWPAVSTVIYDGWLLRFANGYTKRANSISQLYPASIGLDDKIRYCEAIYSEQKQPTIFKITSFTKPQQLDEKLAKLDYSKIDSTSVQITSLQHLKQPTLTSVTINKQLTEQWLTHFCRLTHQSDQHKQTMTQMLANIKVHTAFISLEYDDTVIGCGFGVIEGDYIGLYDIVIDEAYRNRGYAEQMILHLLHYGKLSGANYGYLAVVANNAPALRLYKKLGYSELYTYWYRFKSFEARDDR